VRRYWRLTVAGHRRTSRKHAWWNEQAGRRKSEKTKETHHNLMPSPFRHLPARTQMHIKKAWLLLRRCETESAEAMGRRRRVAPLDDASADEEGADNEREENHGA
jgi:hypothetical protein